MKEKNKSKNKKEDLNLYYNYFDKNETLPDKITDEINTNGIINKTNDSLEEKEENQKRNLREKSFKLIKILIWFQLIFFDVFILLILSSIILNISWFKKIDYALSKLLLEFLKFYIGATIIELLGMLSFVVRFVFSKHKH